MEIVTIIHQMSNITSKKTLKKKKKKKKIGKL